MEGQTFISHGLARTAAAVPVTPWTVRGICLHKQGVPLQSGLLKGGLMHQVVNLIHKVTRETLMFADTMMSFDLCSGRFPHGWIVNPGGSWYTSCTI